MNPLLQLNMGIESATDYYPFGMGMVGRTFSADNYRFGFNGQEKTDEINGSGNHNTAEFWEYDTRLGRRWNVDPVIKEWQSSFTCFSDNPLLMIDPLGNDDDRWEVNEETGKTTHVSEEGGSKTQYIDYVDKSGKKTKSETLENTSGFDVLNRGGGVEAVRNNTLDANYVAKTIEPIKTLYQSSKTDPNFKDNYKTPSTYSVDGRIYDYSTNTLISGNDKIDATNVEFDIALIVYSGGSYILTKQAAKEGIQAIEGIYEFTTTSGKPYVGQSGNIPERINQHIFSGKKIPGTPSKTATVLGGKTAREVAEQLRINSLGGIKNLENIRNLIGPARQFLIPKKP